MPLKQMCPRWPQKPNQLKKVQGLRRRLKAELQLLNDLALRYQVPTAERSALQVLNDVEWVVEQTPSSSPTFSEEQ